LHAQRRRQEAARAHAAALNPLINAFVEITPPAPSGMAGPLGGLPYAAKDMFRTPTREPGCGVGFASGIEGFSDLIERLADASADLVAFTNMTELAYEPSGFNASFGRVRNPWNLEFISGGSSSGSAAVVASGAVVAALGSDTGGSLRIPAHACGVTAWKSSHGLVSTHGVMPLALTLDTVGLLARSAKDLLLLTLYMGLPSAAEPAHERNRRSCGRMRHGVVLFRGISAPSLTAKAGNACPPYFNIERDIPFGHMIIKVATRRPLGAYGRVRKSCG
jgi:Asp-tRNA(Asn)/Glu-tRNA(Gln) amidotransferase A subunit family amidase